MLYGKLSVRGIENSLTKRSTTIKTLEKSEKKVNHLKIRIEMKDEYFGGLGNDESVLYILLTIFLFFIF